MPTALQKTNGALGKLDTLSTTLKTGLKDLSPGVKALGPTLRDTRPFFKDTTPVLRDSIRPFAREAQPSAAKLVPAARHLAKATPDLDTLTKMLNNLVAELAYDPPGNGVHGNSYLYYVPWAGHNTNSLMASQDGLGPVRHTLVLFPCQSLQLLNSTSQNFKDNPTLAATLQLLDIPKVGSCGAGVK